jgi:TonB family protein
MGVDFNPYLKGVLHEVKQHWYELIPESVGNKRGKVVLEFSILKDGSLAGLRIVGSSGDISLDRPAYSSITGSNPFLPLPAEFKGPYLGLRFSYYYNLDGPDFSVSPSAVKPFSIVPRAVKVPTGWQQQFSTITHLGDPTVLWSVGGKGCSGSACGTISATGLYTAPETVPDPPLVTVTATISKPSTLSESERRAIVEITKPNAKPPSESSPTPPKQ